MAEDKICPCTTTSAVIVEPSVKWSAWPTVRSTNPARAAAAKPSACCRRPFSPIAATLADAPAQRVQGAAGSWRHMCGFGCRLRDFRLNHVARPRAGHVLFGITVTRPSLTLLIRGGGLVSRLAAALAQRERAPETLLDLRHKTRRTERPADQLAPSQKDEGGGVGFALEQVGDFPTKDCSGCENCLIYIQMTETRFLPAGG